MVNKILIPLCKLLSKISSSLNLGNGSTWPGHIALLLNKNFIYEIIKTNNLNVIFIVGTNGKTTTAKLIQTCLEENNIKTITNNSGANLVNGIASSLLLNSNNLGKIIASVAIFEVDENILPLITEYIEPDILIVLNLFRDQLDRYGEIDSIAKKWNKTIEHFKKTALILNADDPQVAFLGAQTKLNKLYFGLSKDDLSTKEHQHAADSLLCPKCNFKLNFESFYFSHLGIWGCINCGLKRPRPNLDKFETQIQPGTYAKYNLYACVLACEIFKIPKNKIVKALKVFKPAFGRQEKLIYKDRTVQLLLSKNPISLNESLDTVRKLNGKTIILGLNDRIPDGLDVSWIWDVEIENLIEKNMDIYVYGDRAMDMSLRLKYAEIFNQRITNFEKDLDKLIQNLDKNETIFILPNYSAMLEIRKFLTGRKIL